MLAKKLQRISVVEIGGLLKVLRGHRIILRYALAVSKRAKQLVCDCYRRSYVGFAGQYGSGRAVARFCPRSHASPDVGNICADPVHHPPPAKDDLPGRRMALRTNR